MPSLSVVKEPGRGRGSGSTLALVKPAAGRATSTALGLPSPQSVDRHRGPLLADPGQGLKARSPVAHASPNLAGLGGAGEDSDLLKLTNL